MTQATPRRWFQFHLATFVVGVLITGALLAIELRTREEYAALSFVVRFERRGFPCTYWIATTEWAGSGNERHEVDSFTEFKPWQVALDAAFVLVVLVAAAFVSEAFLRRSAAWVRKPAT